MDVDINSNGCHRRQRLMTSLPAIAQQKDGYVQARLSRPNLYPLARKHMKMPNPLGAILAMGFQADYEPSVDPKRSFTD